MAIDKIRSYRLNEGQLEASAIRKAKFPNGVDFLTCWRGRSARAPGSIETSKGCQIESVSVEVGPTACTWKDAIELEG